MELQLHHGYTFDEAIAASGAGEVQQVLCDGAFVVLPRAVLCFATVSDHKATWNTFGWRRPHWFDASVQTRS